MNDVSLINRRVGWPLVVTAFVLVALTVPRSFSAIDPEAPHSEILFSTYYSQGAMVFLAMFQLTLSYIIKRSPGDELKLRPAAWLTAAGGVLYVATGFISTILLGAAWMTPISSLMIFIGTLMFIRIEILAKRPVLVLVLIFNALGFVLDALVQVLMLNPEAFVEQFGSFISEDRRLLRLGRAAMLAMPAMALLYGDLLPLERRREKLFLFGQHAILFGAGLLGVGLAATALLRSWIMNLTVIPAVALWAGTVIAAYFAWKHTRPLEIFGWVCLALSITLGLGMTLYAFNFLLTIPPPPGFQNYLDIDRHYLRAGHIYMNVMGVMCVFAAVELGRDRARGRWQARGLIAATLFLEGMLVLVDKLKLDTGLLALGPIAVALVLTSFVRLAWQKQKS